MSIAISGEETRGSCNSEHEQLFRDLSHKHAVHDCTVCMTDVELPEMS